MAPGGMEGGARYAKSLQDETTVLEYTIQLELAMKTCSVKYYYWGLWDHMFIYLATI